MALIKCKECGKEVSSKAESCPHCGARVKAKESGCLTVLLVLIGLVTFFTLMGTIKEPSRAGESTISQATSSITENPPTPDPLYTQWHYSVSQDEMTGKEERQAARFSSNTNEFQFPYSGPQRGMLIFRKHPRFGTDAILKIEKGQILCRSYDECNVQIRFDDGPPESFTGVGPSDGSTETVFIEGYKRILDKVAASKRVRISVEIYQEGNPVWDFDVSGLDRAKL
jgi:hypothetical protein